MPCRFVRRALTSALVALTVALAALPATARPYPKILGAQPGLFSTNFKPKTFNNKPIQPLPMWMDMLSRWQKSTACSPVKVPGAPCTTWGWKEALARGQGMKGVDLLRAVNDAFNDDLRYPYITDKDNWGRDDYWATPYQFLERSGDCEDYAIAKYMALKQLGVPDDDMMILSVKLKVKPEIAHAILVVFIGNDGWVLDILNKHVMPQSAAQVLYEPLMAVNTKLWMYLHNVT